ncbi:MAG: site-2 protease family protein [Clostridia bacterium]|nr:site-2 protease family protein [Clostridia bacterium]
MTQPYALMSKLTEVLTSAGGIVLAIVILLAMVTIHEFGHYIAGKLLGFKINEFSIGFGPAIFKKRSKKTGEIFALRVVPLGGYCAFDGEDEEGEEELKKKAEEENAVKPFEEFPEQEEPALPTVQKTEREENETGDEYPEPKGKKFNDLAPWRRIIVLVAGATMNYLLALVLIVIMFACCGQPIYRVVAPEEIITVSDDAGEDPYAQNQNHDGKYALLFGDLLEDINGKRIYLVTDFIDALNGKKAGEEVKLGVLRKDEKGNYQKTTVVVTLPEDANFKSSSDTSPICRLLGVTTGLKGEPVKQGFRSVPRAMEYSVKIGGVILRTLGELLTGKLGLESMGGPVTTIKIASEEASGGLFRFLNIASFIGVNLAVFNLLPIPALDGSKVIFCIIEWIRKKPINRNVEAIIHFIGIIALFAFAILVDILQFAR